MNSRLVYALALGLVGGGLAHVAAVLFLPGFATGKAWQALSATLPRQTPVRADPALLPVAGGDPYMPSVLCRIDLAGGPVHVTSTGPAMTWTAALLSPEGRVLESLNGGSMPGDGPDFIVLPPDAARSRLAANGRGDGAPHLVAVEAGEALLVVRVFRPDNSWAAEADRFLSGIACRTESLAELQPPAGSAPTP